MVTLSNENLLFIYTIYHAFTSIDTKKARNLVLILLPSSLGWGRRKTHGRSKKEGYLVHPFLIHFARDILRLSHAHRIGFLKELAPVESGQEVKTCSMPIDLPHRRAAKPAAPEMMEYRDDEM